MQQAVMLALLLACGAAQAESIPLIRKHGTFVVPVLINNKMTLNFTIDSGASDVSITADVFLTLTRAGTVTRNDFLDTQVYELADGSKQISRRFRIRSLRIGSFEVRDVVASVAPSGGSLLLGQSFLSRLKSWSIDNERQLFVFNPNREVAAPADTEAHVMNWVLVANIKNGFMIFIDVSSIRVTGSVRQANIKFVASEGLRRRANSKKGKLELYTLSNRMENCRDRTETSSGKMTFYYSNGTIEEIPADPLPLKWYSIDHGNTNTVAFDFICAWKPK